MATSQGGTAQEGPETPALASSCQPRSSPGPQLEPAENPAGPQSDPVEPSPPANPRLQALQAKEETLQKTLSELLNQRAALVAETKLPSGLAMPESWSDEQKTKCAIDSAHATINEHIALLHKYNEIKDIGQGLMGLIAESRGVRLATVMEDYGMGEKD